MINTTTAPVSSSSASATNAHFDMISRVKNIFGISLALGLTAFSLSAQNAAQFGNLPLWFEAGSPAKFIAHGAKSEFTVTPSGAEFTLAKAGFESVNGGLQLVGANPAARISGADELTGKINY